MSVVAKFKCLEKTEREWGYEVKLEPTHDNRTFSDATPYGTLELGGIRPEVAAQFKPGKTYDIVVTEEAPK